ncbi:MAG TPA: ribonuclease E inhibitor RraB [Steroidobacteraceae bacterium]
MTWILVALAAAGIAALVRIYFSLQRFRRARADDWDAKMIERVRSQGVDPFKAHAVDFFFALPDAASCDAVRAQLVAEGYDVDVKTVTESSDQPFSLHASKALRLAVPDMQEKSRRFKQLAEVNRGRYDGWAAGAKYGKSVN